MDTSKRESYVSVRMLDRMRETILKKHGIDMNDNPDWVSLREKCLLDSGDYADYYNRRYKSRKE